MAAIALSLSASNSPVVITELVDKLQTDFNYIFPRCLTNTNVSLPYCTKVMLTMFNIRTMSL